MKQIAVLCVTLLTVAGCASLPKLKDENIKERWKDYSDTREVKSLGKCVLEWYESSGRAPGMADLGVLAAGFGLGAETGSLAAPIPLFLYATLIRPNIRIKDRNRFLDYCMIRETGRIPQDSPCVPPRVDQPTKKCKLRQ